MVGDHGTTRMTKSDTDPNFPPVPKDTVPPVANGEDLSGFQGPVPLAVKATSPESAGREAAEYHGQHKPVPRVVHDTIPNQRVLVVDKTPVPPKGEVKVDPPGMTTDPGGRDESPWTKRRGPLVALGVVFVFVAGAVFTKLVVSDPKPNVPTTTSAGSTTATVTETTATNTSPTDTVPTTTAIPTTSVTTPPTNTTAPSTTTTRTTAPTTTVSAPTTVSAVPSATAPATASPSSSQSIFTHP